VGVRRLDGGLGASLGTLMVRIRKIYTVGSHMLQIKSPVPPTKNL